MNQQLVRQLRNRFSRGSGSGGGSSFASAALIALGVTGYAIKNSIYDVDGGQRAIKYSRISGVKEEIIPEGTHFRIPWVETPIIYEIRSKPELLTSITGTKDLQMVTVTCRVLHRPEIEKLPTIYRTLGQNYDKVVLPSIVNEVLKSVIAQFNATQTITQREKISRMVRENLALRASRFNITLDDVSITHIEFSPKFKEAVEEKQIAQQEAQRAAYVVDKAIQDKQSTIVKAQGEAESAQLIGAKIANRKGYVELRRIETAREIATTLSRSNNKVLLNSESLLLGLAEEPIKK